MPHPVSRGIGLSKEDGPRGDWDWRRPGKLIPLIASKLLGAHFLLPFYPEAEEKPKEKKSQILRRHLTLGWHFLSIDHAPWWYVIWEFETPLLSIALIPLDGVNEERFLDGILMMMIWSSEFFELCGFLCVVIGADWALIPLPFWKVSRLNWIVACCALIALAPHRVLLTWVANNNHSYAKLLV